MQKKYKFAEFVTVVAIIVILATVMVYTFSGLIKKAKESDSSQEAAKIYDNLLEDNNTGFDLSEDDADMYIVVDGYVYEVFDDDVIPSTTAECVDDIITSATGTEGTAYYTRHATYNNVYLYTGIQTES